ncbi:PLP-dependent aminotransferase family protein [Bacillus paranthracis]|uniref:MocR-like pyridoxine biosynthesis transcription factor PdxR n=1 Tax=Bacillus cereus group TaxID=86661 RepID=UPI000200F775|nr:MULTISPECIES: PLP-dependent aminotransferase family protein [Bacillus cereus group]ADY19881.1 GntR family transcriptional regulator [Bacillus thuringiensis serovar finitimus YBT-020]MRC74263.1 aminotransferase class I/II-fold pyridoxal phosphate-dependent enzyme [Bacillus thuringiensis]OTX66144.1 GntR family transcriptional regulator [Bacillus thuringiensis serovar finitimus]MCR6799824.1 PLP-dependent aminotransferase family protein [Bacillus paranthracis]MEC3356422.1 PLP-dependent aminotra
MLELTPNLNTQSKIALYVQLYEYIKKEIKDGTIPAFTKLPAKRKLASYLQVSKNTVEAAYEQLLAEGYIESASRKGYFVCKVEQMIDVEGSEAKVEEVSFREENYTFDFTQTGVDTNTFPFTTYRKLINDVWQPHNNELLFLGHPQGELSLREEIANYLYESRGVRCSASQIVLGAGTQILVKLLFQLLKGSNYAVENPGYHRKMVVFEQGEENVQMLSLDRDGICMADLEHSNANVVFVTPSHQFPYGMIMPITRRTQLLQWAKKAKDRYIIEDDYDSEFRYSGKPIPALQGLDTEGKVIYMGTLSKALLPSLRMSYMVLPKKLIKKYQQQYLFYTQSVSRMDQEVIRKFLNEGYWEKHIHKMRVVYRKKRDRLVFEIEKYFSNCVEVIGEDSGLHILLKVHNGMREEELIQEAAKYSIKIYPVSTYYKDGTAPENVVLLGFAILSEEEIAKAIQLLHKAWYTRK